MERSPTTPTSAASSSIFLDAVETPTLLSPAIDIATDTDDVGSDVEAIARELEALEELRRNMKKNLLLRPISTQNLKQSAINQDRLSNLEVETPISASSDVFYSARPLSVTAYYFTSNQERDSELPYLTNSHDADPSPSESSVSLTPDSLKVSPPGNPPQPYNPGSLLFALMGTPNALRPLLIDTRSAGSYLASRLSYSVNLVIPSLILKRLRKPQSAPSSLSVLRQYISTDAGRTRWDALMAPDGPWSKEIVVFDEDMDERDTLAPGQQRSSSATAVNSASAAWTLLSILRPISPGPLYYLEGGIQAMRRLTYSDYVVVSGEWEMEEAEGSDEEGEEGSDAAASNVSSAPSQSTSTLLQLPNTSDRPRRLSSSSQGSGGGSAPAQKGLFSIRTDVAARHKPLPELEPPTAASPSQSPLPSPRLQLNTSLSAPLSLRSPPSPRRSATLAIDLSSPMKRELTATGTSATSTTSSTSSPSSGSPASPPSAFHLRGSPKQPREQRRPSLAKLDISSTEKHKVNAIPVAGPPKLQLRTLPLKSNTLATSTVPAGGSERFGLTKLKIPLNLNTAPTQPVSNLVIVNTPSSPEPKPDYLAAPLGTISPQSNGTTSAPLTPLPPSPMTARPGGSAATSPAPAFEISTILPNFLFLGPELVQESHVYELQSLGVKRILNIAIECDDDAGLGLKSRFEKYIRIPMRDTVEEVNVAKAMREVCDILDDARLHSAPTYVHCKAGKSRSVTAVMAYLIHANHWTLSKAYSFVLDRRKGISPNIGFVSELMTFEEEELGGKSVGVVGGNARGHHRRPQRGGMNGFGYRRHEKGQDAGDDSKKRGAHLRESMPPLVQSYSAVGPGDYDSFTSSTVVSGNGAMADGVGASDGTVVQPMSANPLSMRDMGEEMEVRDAAGRYRHARRAPVDVNTLQPVRRVSKAGLESTSWMEDLN